MVGSTPEVRQLNRERIRRELHVRKTCTKAEMAAWTGLSVSTCNTILNEMRADGEIIRTSQEDGYVGRPASRFEYNADYLHVLVVYVVTDHGENTVAFAVADAPRAGSSERTTSSGRHHLFRHRGADRGATGDRRTDPRHSPRHPRSGT